MTREDELDRLLEEKGLLPQAMLGAPRIRQIDEGAAPDEDLFEVEVDTPEGTRKAVVPRAAASYLQYRDTESTVAELPSLKPGQVLEQPRPAPTALQPKRTAPQVSLRAPQAAAPMRPFLSLAGGAPRPDLDQEGVAIRPMAEQATNGQRVAGEVAGTRLMDGMQAERPMSPEAEAQQQARDRALAVALGRAGAMAGQAISGAQTPMGLYDAMWQEADLPVRELVARRARERQQRLADPTSEESKRLQAAVSTALPGVYTPEELAGISAADQELILKAGEMRQRLEERKAALTAQGQERSEQRAFQAKQQEDEQAFRRELQREQQRSAAARTGAPARGAVVPGLQVAPGAAPTAEDAKKVKQAMVAGERMRAYVKQLRDLHSKYGTEMGATAAGVNMRQLAKAIQIEAKTIAELGALSGPDQQLMESLAGADPTSLGANVKGLLTFGLADQTQSALDQLERWVGDSEAAAKKVYGYQDAPGAAPAPSATGPGQPKRIQKGNRTFEWAGDHWEEVL